MIFAAPLLLMAQDATTIDAAMALYREKTRAVVRCERPADPTEIQVCARRAAYRHQLPLVSTNPRSDANAQANIVHTPEAQGFVECGQGPFMVRCGSVGVGVTVGVGGPGYVRRAPPP